MADRYSPNWVASYFDEFAEQEWGRLSKSVTDEVSLHLHRCLVRRFVRAGMRVLDIGCGPGVFTEQCHELGATVVAADISPVQVDLNRAFGRRRGFGASVEQWRVLDILDMSALAAKSFDVVLALGGPLSYVFGHRQRALAEVRRVLKPQGVLVASVMSVYGGVHRALHATLDALEPAVIASGDLHPSTFPGVRHRCHMFRSPELRADLEAAGFDVAALCGSGCLTAAYPDAELRRHRESPATWAALLALEEEAAAAPGGRDMGDHIIAAARLRPARRAWVPEAVLAVDAAHDWTACVEEAVRAVGAGALLLPLAGWAQLSRPALVCAVNELYAAAERVDPEADVVVVVGADRAWWEARSGVHRFCPSSGTGGDTRLDADRGDPVFRGAEAPAAGFASVGAAGVFDRLHCGHRALLTVAAALARERVVVGVLREPGHKRLAFYIQEPERRAAAVRGFLRRCRGGLEADVQLITRCDRPAACPMAAARTAADAIVVEDTDEFEPGRRELRRCNPGLQVVRVESLHGLRASELRMAHVSRL